MSDKKKAQAFVETIGGIISIIFLWKLGVLQFLWLGIKSLFR